MAQSADLISALETTESCHEPTYAVQCSAANLGSTQLARRQRRITRRTVVRCRRRFAAPLPLAMAEEHKLRFPAARRTERQEQQATARRVPNRHAVRQP